MTGLTLVTGATGRTGRRVAALLEERGVPVRAASRGGAPPFDWERPATWEAALRDVEAAYLCFAPDLALDHAAATVGAFAELAAARGVRRTVLLSGRGEEGAERAERAVLRAAPAATVLRCAWFSQNFSENFLRDPVVAGEVALPVDGVPEPFVDLDDVAEAAVRALTEPGFEGRVLALTGPRSLTFAEAVAEIGAATGREIGFVPVTPDDYAAGARAAGVPEDVVEFMVHLFTEVLDGRNALPEDGVRTILGRPPRDFRDYARRAAQQGAWADAA